MIEYIEYKKKKYPIRISYMAIMGLKKDTGKGLEDMGSGMDEKTIESLLFHSLKSGAVAEGNEMPFKKADLVDILEECFMDFISMIPKFFPDNKAGQSAGKQLPNRQQRRATTPKKGKA